jgi:hypothetical protein
LTARIWLTPRISLLPAASCKGQSYKKKADDKRSLLVEAIHFAPSIGQIKLITLAHLLESTNGNPKKQMEPLIPMVRESCFKTPKHDKI